MISRFFKKKAKASEPKKMSAEKPRSESPREKPSFAAKRLLSAEGWKRIMMRKMSKKN